MPKLSWNEIRQRAHVFSAEWRDASSERADKQTFWNQFFDVFGMNRRALASFEERVKRETGRYGFIDLFWKNMLLVEHKSRGESLDKADSQAFAYIQDLINDGRQDEVPRYVIVSDFQRIALHDLEPDEQLDLPLFAGRRVETIDFPLSELHRYIHAFAFIPGYKQHHFADPDPINIKAVSILGNLHRALEGGGYRGHYLERFLVRVLFCLFAQWTGIFEQDEFRLYIENRTAADGSDLGRALEELFRVLDTPKEDRQTYLDETLANFPYVNGELFRERLDFAAFNKPMREALLRATEFDWSQISPAIFGALFQSIMVGEELSRERRQIGAHYTSERDILKVIRPLFLDKLRSEFEVIRNDSSTRQRSRLDDFLERLTRLKFLDPACGCGNFLVIAFRELRLLELDALKLRHGTQTSFTLDEVNRLSRVDVDQFYGIEISEWPARIAEVAIWLMDHQMNIKVSEAFGQLYQRLPLKKSPHITVDNALRLDWQSVLPSSECSYVLGNPPFVGHHYQSAEQKKDQKAVLKNISAAGVLDYVCNWYIRSAEYIIGTEVVAAFVSTNSITQGEQAGILWSEIFSRYHLKISFAYRTFAWQSEARGKAHVHVVVIGISSVAPEMKLLFEQDPSSKNSSAMQVRNIGPYLVEGPDLAILNRPKPLCDVPAMTWGNKPTDGGGLILSSEERYALLQSEPTIGKYIRRYMSGGDFLNDEIRYCLWLKDAKPEELRRSPAVISRLERVRSFRLSSDAQSTRKYADYPSLFRQTAQPDTDYLAIPEVSSERRAYIPMAYISRDVICSNTVQFVRDATQYHFGVLSSRMHMAWVKQVAGRLESRYRYSNTLVYNNFPWPENPTGKQRAAVERAAEAVLEARTKFPDSTLADLYDPRTMPPELLRAHTELDRAVDRCYRAEPFTSDRQRVEYLFSLYEKLTAPLLPVPARRKRAAWRTHA